MVWQVEFREGVCELLGLGDAVVDFLPVAASLEFEGDTEMLHDIAVWDAAAYPDEFGSGEGVVEVV